VVAIWDMHSSKLPTSHFARKSSTSYWCVLCNLWLHEFYRVQEGAYIFIVNKEVMTHTNANCVLYDFMNFTNGKRYHICYNQRSVPNWYLNFVHNHMTIFLYQFVITCFSTRYIALIFANTSCSTTLYLWSRVLLVKLINSGATQEIPHSLWNMKIFYRVHNNLPLVPVHSHLSHFCEDASKYYPSFCS